jgi:hypothetical protein
MTTTPEKSVLAEEGVRALARDWFRALDRHEPWERVARFLVPVGLTVVLPELTLRTPDDVQAHHEASLLRYFDEVRELTRTDVRLLSGREAELSLTVNWQTKVWTPPEPVSVWKGFDIDQTWTVVWYENEPRIRSIVVHQTTPMPGSPAL